MVEIPNVLAARYASPSMVDIWSPRGKVVQERHLWLAVLRAQADLGLDVPADVIAAYEAVVDDVDLDSIAARERVTRHDVKARIEEFNALAGHEHVHKGMTSRDLTENVEQLQVRRALEHVRDRCVAALARLARLATEHSDLVIAGRSHNVAAQATTALTSDPTPSTSTSTTLPGSTGPTPAGVPVRTMSVGSRVMTCEM